MISSVTKNREWNIWLIIGVISIAALLTDNAVAMRSRSRAHDWDAFADDWFTGRVFSQLDENSSHEKDIYLKPAEEEVVRSFEEKYFVSCHSPRGVHTIWTKHSGEQIKATKGKVHIEEARRDRGVSLVFESINRKDKGNYTCTSTVDGRQVQASFRLVVIKPITFLDTSPVQNASEHDNAVVRCEVEGDPKPTILWSINGKNVQEPKYKVVEDGLSIMNVTMEDKGEYHCRAFQLSPDISSVLERTIILNIQHKPKWQGKEGSDVAYGFPSGVVNLTCMAVAEPEAEFEWFRFNKTIIPKENVIIFNEKHMSVLQLVVTNQSFGEYMCKATNALGKMEQIIKLQEGTKPDVPEVVIKDATADSLELEIEAPPAEDLPILGYRVQYMRKIELDDKGWDAATILDFDKDAVPFIITGLSQDTQYGVRVAARNAAGFSDFSVEIDHVTHKLQAETVTDTTNKASDLQSAGVLYQLINIIFLHCIFFTGRVQSLL